MPVPNGQITTTNIWTGKGEDNESNQETQTEETDTGGEESTQSSEDA